MSLFLKRKEIWTPTLLSWLLILPISAFILFLMLGHTYDFLAITKEPETEMLVVEGWIPETGLRKAIDYYHDHNYKYMVITGVPITQWSFSSPYSNMADASARSMREMFFKDSIYIASIPSTVVRDRTYGTAVSLKMKMEEGEIPMRKFDLFTMGAHARRSHLMYQKAIDTLICGVITDTDLSYNPPDWYKTSYGFRIVISELISYLYSRVLFFPYENQMRNEILDGRYVDSIQKLRFTKDRECNDSVTSPLDSENRRLFRGLHYYPVNRKWKVDAMFIVDTTASIFGMKTSTDRLPLYRKYGTVHFSIGTEPFQLTVFQNMDHLKKNPDSKYLFLPFNDLTSGKTSYGGGRYIDMEITDKETITIDFNLAYNPYCAYASRWSCPVPPPENFLNLAVEAGEMKFHQVSEIHPN